MKYLPLIWAGLWRKPLRTILTLLSIIVAFLLFGMLQGVNAALDQSIAGAAVDRLIVQSRINFTEPLPSSYLPRLEGVPGITGVAYASWFGPYFQDPKNFIFTFPIDPERYFGLFPELKLPKEQLDAFVHTRTGAVIGLDMANKYGWKVGDRVPLHSTIWTNREGNSDWNFDIVGIYSDPEDHSNEQIFFLNHTYFDEGRSFGKGTIGWYIVRIADPHQAAAMAGTIDKLFANSSDETKTMTERESAQAFLKQQGDINFIATSIIGAVFFTLLFLTGNTMMQSVRERIPEFAVLKTLGFSENGVLTLVLAESLALCIAAALIGLALAELAFPFLKQLIGTANLPGSVILLGLAVAVLLALITGLPPALRARRLNIVDALAGR
jgi:putative ABC transport system permease protein